MALNKTIPLFPLQLVLFPNISLPLHIFEDRYKKMINICLENEREFGIVLTDGKQLQKFGCTAEITKILNKYDDGRMDIMTVGRSRFKINSISEEKAYLQGDVTFFEDENELESPEMLNLAKTGIGLLKELESIARRREYYDSLTELNIQVISFIIADAYGITLPAKQAMLEMTSVQQRLDSGVSLLKRVIEQIKLSEKLAKIIKKPDRIHGFYTN